MTKPNEEYVARHKDRYLLCQAHNQIAQAFLELNHHAMNDDSDYSMIGLTTQLYEDFKQIHPNLLLMSMVAPIRVMIFSPALDALEMVKTYANGAVYEENVRDFPFYMYPVSVIAHMDMSKLPSASIAALSLMMHSELINLIVNDVLTIKTYKDFSKRMRTRAVQALIELMTDNEDEDEDSEDEA